MSHKIGVVMDPRKNFNREIAFKGNSSSPIQILENFNRKSHWDLRLIRACLSSWWLILAIRSNNNRLLRVIYKRDLMLELGAKF